MNGVMAGMIAVMVTWMSKDPIAKSPLHARFWFVMSIALCAGFIVAYPINWWLVSRGLKHGMMTERPEGYAPSHPTPEMAPTTTPREMLLASLMTLGVLGVGVVLASTLPHFYTKHRERHPV
jgi:hypothetical protein